MRKIVLTFGLIAGAVLSAMMLVTQPFMDRIGFDRAMVIGYTTMVLAFLMVYFGIRAYRDEVAGGHVTFGRALVVGLLITAVASVCYVATWQVVYHRIAPDFMAQYSAHEIAKARQAGATEAEIAAKSREMAEFAVLYQNPLFNIGFTFLEPLPVGVLFSLVSAGMLSRRRRVEHPAIA
ncbi:MAG: DUF4199 domain-containing protein [Gemmatirosa sp.]